MKEIFGMTTLLVLALVLSTTTVLSSLSLVLRHLRLLGVRETESF